jgi:hypothetical protein
MQRLWVGLVLPVILFAAEPSAEDQAAMQDVLRRYLRAVNTCDSAAARAELTSDFTARGFAGSNRQMQALNLCAGGTQPFEIAALARVLYQVTDDVATSDAFFRTAGRSDGEVAGRVYVTFVKRDRKWRIFSMRFHPYTFEPPLIGVEPAKYHDPAGGDGWVTLFDGNSTRAFQDASGGEFPAHRWRVEDGTLRAIAGKGGRSLRTRDTYRSFELQFEWKSPAKGNSGIKYRLFYLLGSPEFSDGAGFEYQIADDAGDPGAVVHPAERSGSLYNQIAARGAVLKPLGEYNQSSIIVRGRHCEHWLNGVRVLEFETESNPPESPILIQHHQTDMWFRNIRIRRLD